MTKTRNLSDLLDANGDVKSASLDNVPAVDLTNLSATNLTSGTVADARLPATALNSNVDLTNLSASNLTSGTVATARLGTGTADATTFLRGDNTFAAPSGGLSNAQQWRTSASRTGVSNGDIISANWEEADTDGYGRIGDAMTQSSGTFTFPATGYWLIEMRVLARDGDTTNDYIGTEIFTTTNNSSYGGAARGMNNTDNNQYVNVFCSFLFDVTNTSTHKVRFTSVSQNGNVEILGATTNNETSAIFTRLGST